MTGWMPNATVKPAPTTNFYKGRAGQTCKAVVLHIAEGSYIGSTNWLTNPASGVSAHFIVSKAGDITQMVSLYDTAYANGLSWNGSTWIDPEGSHVTPPWPGLTPPTNPNFQTVSVEHEGHSGEAWTPAMIAADVHILEFVHTIYPLTWAPHTSLIGHFEISPVNRAHCPGTGCPFDTIAAAANGAGPMPGVDYAALWGTAWPYFAQSGIATEWRRAALTLGAATSDEHSESSGRVVRHFVGGFVAYDPKTGTLTSYFARPA